MKAIWRLSLDCQCPECFKDIDLIEDTNFFLDTNLYPCENGTERSRGVEVVCSYCGHEFTVDLEY